MMNAFVSCAATRSIAWHRTWLKKTAVFRERGYYQKKISAQPKARLGLKNNQARVLPTHFQQSLACLMNSR
jgi:hypothetical protein